MLLRSGGKDFDLRVATRFGMGPLVASDLHHGLAALLIVLEEALLGSLGLLLEDLLGLDVSQLFEVHRPCDVVISLRIVILMAIHVSILKRPLVVPQERQLILYIRQLLLMILHVIGAVRPRLHPARRRLDMMRLLPPLPGRLKAGVETFFSLF